jgi:hypothetical protein
MLSERAEFVAAAFAATTNSARGSKHLHFLVPLRKFSGGWPDPRPFSPDRDPPAGTLNAVFPPFAFSSEFVKRRTSSPK